jgi:hypothetical protein
VQWRSTMNRLVVAFVILAVLLFVPAGRITWTRGWIFLLVFTLLITASIAYFTHANPEMFAVRSRVHPGTKRWDKIVMCLLSVAIVAIPPVAGLDDGRFHWSSMSCWVVALGYLVQLAGWIGVAWAQTVNRFFEPGVRIQTERGHHVIDTGPYALTHRFVIIEPLLSDGSKLPKRLEPLSSVVAYGRQTPINFDGLSEVKAAYAETGNGRIFTGTSQMLNSLVRVAKESGINRA